MMNGSWEGVVVVVVATGGVKNETNNHQRKNKIDSTFFFFSYKLSLSKALLPKPRALFVTGSLQWVSHGSLTWLFPSKVRK